MSYRRKICWSSAMRDPRRDRAAQRKKECFLRRRYSRPELATPAMKDELLASGEVELCQDKPSALAAAIQHVAIDGAVLSIS